MATKVVEELNLEEKVTVKNIANWTVGFRRKTEMEGDISIAPNGQVRLSRNEIIAQVQTDNKLFSGTDGRGSHATLLIDDEATRKELDFDSEDGKSKQLVFSDELVKNVFAVICLSSLGSFPLLYLYYTPGGPTFQYSDAQRDVA